MIIRKRVEVQDTIPLYPPTYLQTHAQVGGFKQKVPRKVHVNTASKEEKERFKKEQERYYWILSKKKKKKDSL